MVAGSLSDRLGRRPVLVGALLVELLAMLLFAVARDVDALLAARVVQGLATGVATGALSAALIDLQPPGRPQLGAVVSGAAPLLGLAAGALGSGLLVQYAPDPLRLVFWLLAGAFVLALAVVVAMPEPVAVRRPDWLGARGPASASRATCGGRSSRSRRSWSRRGPWAACTSRSARRSRSRCCTRRAT